jgi:1,4-alpha-glucan branching enzyme
MHKSVVLESVVIRAGFLAIIVIMFTVSASGQLLTGTPKFPQGGGSVNIVVDCTKGNQGLMNYVNTADVYVHVGVITNLSANSSDWKYVPFTWGTTNPAANATSLGNNKYLYTINNIRSFFGVPAGETILAVAILFRNGAGSLIQRNSDGNDMYIAVYGNSLSACIVLPPYQPEYIPVPEPINLKMGDTLPVKYMASKTAALKLYFNGVIVSATASADSLQSTLHITTPGNQQVIATASDGVNSISDTINFYVAGAVNIALLPAGVNEGINYLKGDTSAVLVLFAPLKNKILVVGDFNGWVQEPAYQMNRTPDNNYYWLTISGLTPGKEYAYQYVIDDTITVADYNTEKVLDKNADPSIPASTYPALKPFPAGAGGSLASIIQTAQPAYSWQVSNFRRPDKKGLVIYELLLRDFLNASNWQSLMDTLGYLKRLGANAIEVMPFNNFEGASSWGYNPNFYFAPDKVYGTANALKQFVDACHGLGMAVIMDMVLNHSFGSSPMVQMYFDNQNGVPALNNPWFNQYPTHADNVGYQFNHESTATKTFTQRVIAYWLNNYHIDGYRFDLAKGFTQTRTCDGAGNNCNVAAWGAYDASRVAIWDTIYNQLQAISPASYCILEMFADNSEQTVEANYGMLLWGNMNENFNQATMGYGTPSPDGATWDLSGALYTGLGWNQPGLVVYQESHDEERLMYKNEQYGNSSGAYNVKTISTGLQRNAMAATFWAMLPGPKMLWEFGELGYDYSINTCGNGTVDGTGNCRTDPKPSGWPYLSDTARVKLQQVYMAMLKLRSLFPGLAVPSSVKSDLSGAFKSLQLTTDSLSVVVIGNFDVVPATGNIPFPVAGVWYNYQTGGTFAATGGSQSITLAPGEYRVYLNKSLVNTDTVPGGGVVVPVSSLAIHVYPSPVSASGSTVAYQLPESGNVLITVLDQMGQILGMLGLGNQPAGAHTLSGGQLPFNFSSLSDGYYVLKILCNGKTARVPFLVVRR